MIAYIVLFSALLSRLTAPACGSTWVTSFIARFFLNIHRSGVLTAQAWLVPHETAAVSVQVLCTPYNHAPCHFMQRHIRKVHACLAATCHLHVWQNDRDLLRATAVTRRWNGYRNKSQHRKSTLEKKILPPLQQGFEPANFQSRVRRSNHWAIPANEKNDGGRTLDVYKSKYHTFTHAFSFKKSAWVMDQWATATLSQKIARNQTVALTGCPSRMRCHCALDSNKPLGETRKGYYLYIVSKYVFWCSVPKAYLRQTHNIDN